LESLLIMPVQRIPRYNLLLRDLLRRTDDTHADFSNLTNALEQFENVMSYLDTNITEAENMKKFLEMGTRFKGGNVCRLCTLSLSHSRTLSLSHSRTLALSHISHACCCCSV
jgi:hypothetical protein